MLTDAVLSFQLLKPGGLLVFDDYRFILEDRPEERPAVAIDAFLTVFTPRCEVLHRELQLVVRKRE